MIRHTSENGQQNRHGENLKCICVVVNGIQLSLLTTKQNKM